MKVTVIPLVVEPLGTPTKTLGKRLKAVGIETKINELQKTVLIHNNRIVRKVHEV